MQSARHQANDEIVSIESDADRQKKLISFLSQLGEERAELRKKSEQLDDIQMRFFNEFVAGGANAFLAGEPAGTARESQEPSKGLSTQDPRQRTIMSSSIGVTILLISLLEIFQPFFGYRISPTAVDAVAAVGVVISILLFAVFATKSRRLEHAEG